MLLLAYITPDVETLLVDGATELRATRETVEQIPPSECGALLLNV